MSVFLWIAAALIGGLFSCGVMWLAVRLATAIYETFEHEE